MSHSPVVQLLKTAHEQAQPQRYACIEAAHTPGPWEPRGGGHSIGDPAENHPDMMDWCSGVDCNAPFTENEHGNYERVEQQAVAKGYGKTLKEAQANALLIAAAPEMLEALKHIERIARIARSKGMHDADRKAAFRDVRDHAGAAIAKATGSAA